MKSLADCRVLSSPSKESKDERRRGSGGSTDDDSSYEGRVLEPRRPRRVRDGARGSADDDAPTSSSGDGGAEALAASFMLKSV